MKRSKREFLKAGAGVAAMVAMPGALAQTPAGWQPSARYPDPAVKAVDASVMEEVNDAYRFADEAPDQEPGELYTDVYADS
mgnify:CR=1 FL=1